MPYMFAGHRVSDAATQQVRRMSRGVRALARASRSIARPLSLQAADITEFVPPALRGDAEWWNYLSRRSMAPRQTDHGLHGTHHGHHDRHPASDARHSRQTL